MSTFRLRYSPSYNQKEKTSDRVLTAHLYADFLQYDCGIKPLGRGIFSVVFPLSNDRVLKVGDDMGGWPVYIHWADQHGLCGTLAPRVYSLKIYPCFYTATIERLYPFAYNDDAYNHASDARNASNQGNAGVIKPYWKPLADAQHKTPLTMNDISDHNILQRSTGEAVLSDPIALRWPMQPHPIYTAPADYR